ncbi:MAG: S-layer homology domain-containing protein [Acutalibacter sp.]
MKQFWSKSLACLLCLALLAGMLPMAALAAQDTHQPETYAGPTEPGWQGAGTENDPYQISTLADLAALRDAVNDGNNQNGTYFKMTANIDLGNANNAWKSIGNFTGTFDGAGYKISGLYLNAGNLGSADRGLGLFTMVGEGGTVENLTVEGEIDPTGLANIPIGGIAGRNNGGTISNCTSSVDITGSVDSNVGGIVGSGESGTIENCCNTGSINVTGSVDSNVGGIVGLAGNPNGRVTVTVENCENTGNVTVKGNADGTGGIVGGADSGTVSNCRNSGSIDGNESITGGIVGDNYGAISRCNNTGAVSADGATGGVAGQNVCSQSGPNSIVENCYNTGAVSGSGDVGGVVGHNNNSNNFISTVKNCYNTGAVISGNSSNVGGVVGRIETGDVSDCYYLNTSAAEGIGSVTGETGTKVENIILKTAGQFSSGEVAWLLQSGQAEQNGQVWGQQNLGDADSLPELTSEENYSVIQVTFKVSEEDTQPYTVYTTPGSTVTFPADPEAPEGQAFAGWYSGDTKCESGATFKEDTTLTAKFETPYTVTVNGSYAAGTGAGSYLEGASVTVSAGARPGYRFAGWTAEGVTLTNASAETVTFVMPASNVTLTASWDYIVIPSDPTYPPTMDEPENGTVTTSPSRPEEGDTVTITPKPDEGFEVDEILVKDEDGNPVEVTQNPDGTYTFTQPDGKVTITVTFRCDGGELCPGHHLTDVSKDAWYHAAVDYAVEHGIMEGVSETEFSPNTEVTRAQAVQILYNLEGQPDISDENLGYPYEDVNAEEWYGNAVYWARLTGVATGYGDGTFQPGDSITRQEFAQMLYNYAKYKGYDLTAEGDLSQFLDSGSVADWAEIAMSWANGNELINGHDDGTIDAAGTAIRAQAASILMKFDQNLVEK